jgi:putative oxidoreductase
MVMLVAIFTVHISKGFFMTNGGWELNAAYIASAVAVAYAGNGAYSLDRVFGFDLLSSPQAATILMIAAIVLAGLNLLVRRPAPQQAG